jgi:hypothetical protein
VLGQSAPRAFVMRDTNSAVVAKLAHGAFP